MFQNFQFHFHKRKCPYQNTKATTVQMVYCMVKLSDCQALPNECTSLNPAWVKFFPTFFSTDYLATCFVLVYMNVSI
jgi:hypothetical protein